MDKDQIRQIAEEYREDIINRIGIPKDFISADVRKGLAGDCTAILNWLSTRYCVVERSKVEALESEIHCAIMDAHNDDDMQMVAHEVLDVMPRRFAAIFGSETFDKKEDD